MDVKIYRQGTENYPPPVRAMHTPPATLYYRGNMTELLARPRVAIVGTRQISPYGQQVTRRLSGQLAAQGIVIVSGLAFGVDAAAHRAALEAKGLTLAVLPSPVEAVAPSSHRRLAEDIIASGGALISQYPAGSENHKGNFVARNELVAALCDVLIVTEAALQSGSRHTVAFANTMGKTIFAVPGNITSPLSAGTNHLLKSAQAGPVTAVGDILEALKLPSTGPAAAPTGDTPAEQAILTLLAQGIRDGDELLMRSKLPANIFNQSLTMLEITAKVTPLGANQWAVS